MNRINDREELHVLTCALVTKPTPSFQKRLLLKHRFPNKWCIFKLLVYEVKQRLTCIQGNRTFLKVLEHSKDMKFSIFKSEFFLKILAGTKLYTRIHFGEHFVFMKLWCKNNNTRIESRTLSFRQRLLLKVEKHIWNMWCHFLLWMRFPYT